MTAYVVKAPPIHENSINYFSAELGFYRLGYVVERFDLQNIQDLKISGDTPVFGGVPEYTGTRGVYRRSWGEESHLLVRCSPLSPRVRESVICNLHLRCCARALEAHQWLPYGATDIWNNKLVTEQFLKL